MSAYGNEAEFETRVGGSLAPLARRHPEAVDFGQAGFGTGMEALGWQAVVVQESRRVCRGRTEHREHDRGVVSALSNHAPIMKVSKPQGEYFSAD